MFRRKPRLGAVVYYCAPDARVIVSLVTAVLEDGAVNLTVFEPGRLPGDISSQDGVTAPIPYAKRVTPGCWSWPPRFG